jgi:hypothetical protein
MSATTAAAGAATTAVVVPPPAAELSIRKLKSFAKFARIWETCAIFGGETQLTKDLSPLVHAYIGARGLQIMARVHLRDFDALARFVEYQSRLERSQKDLFYYPKGISFEAVSECICQPALLLGKTDAEAEVEMTEKKYALLEKAVEARFQCLLPHIGGIAGYFNLPLLRDGASFRNSGHPIARVERLPDDSWNCRDISIAIVTRDKTRGKEELYIATYAAYAKMPYDNPNYIPPVRLEGIRLYNQGMFHAFQGKDALTDNGTAQEMEKKFKERTKGSLFDPFRSQVPALIDIPEPDQSNGVVAAIVDLVKSFMGKKRKRD